MNVNQAITSLDGDVQRKNLFQYLNDMKFWFFT